MPETNKIYKSKDKRLCICTKINCENAGERCDIFKILVNQSFYHTCGDIKRNLFLYGYPYPKCDCSLGIIIMELGLGI